MVTLSTKEMTLQSDRIPVYVGLNRFYLKKGLQSSNRNVEIANELIKEQGNRLNRGISIKQATITFSMEDLAVDTDMEQLFSSTWTTVASTSLVTAASGTIGLKLQATKKSGGLQIFVVGPTDKINCLVVAYNSGTAGALRVGEGAPITGASATTVTVSAAKAINFSVGDTVLVVKNKAATQTTTATITDISGGVITISGFNPSTYTASSFIMVNDANPISSAKFYNGKPNSSVKGIEVVCYNSTTNANVSNASIMAVGYVLLSAVGSTVATQIDSDGWRDSSVDILMLYNDYDDNLLFTRYLQGVSLTGANYAFSGDGFAKQTYDFQTMQSMDFAGYILRKSFVLNSGDISASGLVKLGVTSGINTFVFNTNEAPIAIEASTSINVETYDKYFLKVVTMASAGGSRTEWREVQSAPVTGEFMYTPATRQLRFYSGSTKPLKGYRVELTYLCTAANVAAGDEYKFDTTADYKHTGTPDAVMGQYQPLTINSADFTDRLDGLDSSSIGISFSRDYQKSQGQLNAVLRPSGIGTVDGSFATKEGYCKVMSVIIQSGANGGNDFLAAGTQMDVNKSAKYTNINTIPLRVKLFDPADNTTVVKTITVPSIQVKSLANSNGIGNDSTFTVNFMGKGGNIIVDRI